MLKLLQTATLARAQYQTSTKAVSIEAALVQKLRPALYLSPHTINFVHTRAKRTGYLFLSLNEIFFYPIQNLGLKERAADLKSA